MTVIYIRQTGMGATVWQLYQNDSLVCQSPDYGSRAEAKEALDKLEGIVVLGMTNIKDQTPEGRLEAKAKQ